LLEYPHGHFSKIRLAMRIAFLLCLVINIFVGIGTVDAWEIKSKAPAQILDLCKVVQGQLEEFRYNDHVLNSLLVEFNQISVCRKDFGVWFWQGIESNQVQKLIEIRNSAAARIQEIKRMELCIAGFVLLFIVLCARIKKWIVRVLRRIIVGVEEIGKHVLFKLNYAVFVSFAIFLTYIIIKSAFEKLLG
jgi:hypothetical protein